ncbi:TPA: hypothetical protein ACPWGG_003767 [Pseudomonas aeruginosa]|uniref:hypothetical protein n=1 Tax=Pseudomonas aeruginosa TaxID=287 RepID=UPI000EB29BAB|nr:hypothetical protein [Pseudomonas aeruginosa]MCV6433195.1 hypothetical protein [Pseudomonas aeruginosa]MCV6440825.1 hypothetical protein [Pseudomonas aeruginosa]HBP1105779.1 hypothetical protein [Pseudomonas aeruginosa]HCE9725911.1 hypothetical protein [Pseudomonas aeruginosa]HCE9807274.1 hypothetical protein [Pseudomonas aeruginosa]
MWTEFLITTQFESLVRELTLHTLAEARLAWPACVPFAGFAFNCSSAWGDVHISLACDPARAVGWEPPDWEHECAEAELAAVAPLWRERYEPVRERYEAERASHEGYPEAFLHGLRRMLVGMELDGVFADCPGIRLLVTEVDADTEAEEAALALVRREMLAERGLTGAGGSAP